MTEIRSRTLPRPGALDALKAVAFDLIPEPAMVVDRDGALVAVNEAAEDLFGQGLALLARGRFKAALPADSALVTLINRALAAEGAVRERGIEIALFGHPSFEADGAAAALGDGAVLLTLATWRACGRSWAWAACWPTRSRTPWPAFAAPPSC
jgi:two-component system nitrogen regulation sensor histidine kinase GlnL